MAALQMPELAAQGVWAHALLPSGRLELGCVLLATPDTPKCVSTCMTCRPTFVTA
jgi:hypothetical protein